MPAFSMFSTTAKTPSAVINSKHQSVLMQACPPKSKTAIAVSSFVGLGDGTSVAVRRKFNESLPSDKQLLKDCLSEAKDQLGTLKKIDSKMTTSLLFAATGFALSWVSGFFAFLGIAGACYAARQSGLREAAEINYYQAVNNAMHCVAWVLSDRDGEALVQSKEVSELLTFLAPLVSDQQLRDVIADDYEDQVVNMVQKIRDNGTVAAFDTISGSKNPDQPMGPMYACYGLEQKGGPLSVIKWAFSRAYDVVMNAINKETPRTLVHSYSN